MIPRLIETNLIKSLLQRQKIHLLLGARQVGKTVLLHCLEEKLKKRGKTVRYFNGDLDEDRKVMDTTSLTVLTNAIKNTDFLFLDEAQRLANPGLTLKIIHDNLPQVKVLATGSSSFELKNQMSEALTGRYVDFTFYPFSVREVLCDLGKISYFLENFIIYGFYPEIYLTPRLSEKRLLLDKITESYLFRDIFSFQKIRKPQVIVDLAKALSYQIGSEVNENELSNRLKIDRKTIVSYLDILEKAYVIFRLYPYSRNPRREIGRRYKVYFWDLGIRNALISDFNDWEIRNDRGALWENFLIVERQKNLNNNGESAETHFWRNYNGAEIDYLEKTSGQWRAFEFKYGEARRTMGAKSFKKEYGINIKVVSQENYSDFLSF